MTIIAGCASKVPRTGSVVKDIAALIQERKKKPIAKDHLTEDDIDLMEQAITLFQQIK